MFTTKRILAALLCAATFAVSFASCSGTSDTGSPADTTAGGDTETTAAETTTAP